MSNPTTPFSWQMPTATDLVTDLPADFEVFGQAVATSMADLLGGTTGQVLSKTSATDMDFTWTTPQVGDITGVTAGTGISGGGTSGTVTVTNSMATAIDAKGDLIGGTGADTFARLAVGANATVLTADSTEATGMKWAAPASTSLPAFAANSASNQSITQNVFTKITFGTEEFDTNSNFASSRFTPTVAGYYQISGGMVLVQGSSLGGLYLFKNGSNYKGFGGQFSTEVYVCGSILTYLNGSTDYVEMYVYPNGTTPVLQGGNATQTWFTGVGVRA